MDIKTDKISNNIDISKKYPVKNCKIHSFPSIERINAAKSK
jgi:hypothetical protein